MKRVHSLFVGLSVTLLGSQSVLASDELWRSYESLAGETQSISSVSSSSERASKTANAQLLELNVEVMKSVLSAAPRENSGVPGVVIKVPLDGGEFIEMELFESPIMETSLAEKFPDVKTFKGYGTGNTAATARFDFTESGFRGMVVKDGETYYFDPEVESQNALLYQRYARSAYIAESDNEQFTCDVVNSHTADQGMSISNQLTGTTPVDGVVARVPVSGGTLHTYRLAVATTGEYTQFHGGTVAAGMSAVVTAVNRINGIYERELSVRFTLVGNNDQVIYTNASTDPYSNNDGYAMLSENKATLDSVIGAANYDIGHVFSTGGGGIAQLQAPCGTYKAEGVTGSGSPTNDAFWVDYVAHEIGHQMGANHTFNGSQGACGGNRAASAAYEPGSGSTIMGYAGICGSDNLSNHSDDYFHAKSQQEVASFIGGFGSSCGVHNNSGNQIPVVDAGVDATIPQQTPFALTGEATDANGDTLTYNWEQYDLGASTAPGVDNGSSPIFRSFPATASATRTFPMLSTLLNNTAPPKGSVLPSTSRVLDFRLTVRDGKGGVAYDDSRVQVTANAGPFRITSPNSSLNWLGGTVQQVNWDVANTDQFPVNCSSVDILFSDDNGVSFSRDLLSAVPNDGSASIVVPNEDVGQARIKVACSDSIFFDISDVPLSITAGTAQAVTNLNVSMLGTTGKWQKGSINFDVKVSNADSNTAHNPVLMVTLPEAVEFGEYVSDTMTCELDQLVLQCDLPDLESAEESVVKVTVLTEKQLTKFDFSAEVSSDELEVDTSDNSVTQKFGGALNVILVALLGGLLLRRRKS